MFKFKIKIGDKVRILSGNYKGKIGNISKIFFNKFKVIVSGINIVKKHIKSSSENPKGIILDKEAPLHISNVAIIDPNNNNITKIKIKRINGEKGSLRISKKSGYIYKNVIKNENIKQKLLS